MRNLNRFFTSATLGLPPGYNRGFCTDAISVTSGSNEFNADPIFRIPAVVAKQNGALVRIHDDDIGIAVIIIIRSRSGSANECLREVSTGCFRYIGESAVAVVLKHLIALGVGFVVHQNFDNILWMSVCAEYIQMAVVIVI